jgi:hypothetical protein
MMRDPRPVTLVLLSTLLFAPIACGGAGAPEAQQASQDPLAAELERLTAFLQSHPGQIQATNQPVLTRAEEDLRAGRRQLALQRLATVRGNVAAATYRNGVSADSKDMAKLDAEWERMGGVLREDLGAPSPEAFAGAPAAARALGEAARAQVRGYYRASLDYAHNTMPDQGYYYLGSAQGQREIAAFSRTLSASSSLRTPALRSIRPELESLEADMLAVYRPPLSIERHGEFIVTSSTLKEARELDAAGLRHGALLRYLQAAQLFAPLRQPAPPALAAEALDQRLREHEARISAGAAGGIDHSIGQLFLETAQAEPAAAPIIAGDVLPRYFAALEPARPAAPKPAPQATVTLVRWPYT